MKSFSSKLVSNSQSFQKNMSENLMLIKKMRDLENRALEKSELRRSRFNERFQLSPRDRLKALLDPGMPFLELFNMTGYLVNDPNPETTIPGSSIISGIGFVNSTRCMIWVDDSGINAGAITMKSVEKGIECIKLARVT